MKGRGGGDRSTQFGPAVVTWTRHNFTTHTHRLTPAFALLPERSRWTPNSKRMTHTVYHRDTGVCCLGGMDNLKCVLYDNYTDSF